MTDFITGSPDHHGFVEQTTGRRFVPFGANYFDPKVGWAPKIWSRYNHDTVARQLAQVASLGLNCIRVFLDFGTLAPRERQYSEEGFAKVDDMVALAGANDIRIIFSGANFWEGRPDYRYGDEYADPHQLDLVCDLWVRLAKRYGRNPTVMTWDLRNEPMVGFLKPENAKWVPVEPRLNAWREYAKKELGQDVQALPPVSAEGVDRKLYGQYIRWLEGLADNWVARQCQALRGAGARQMISVGMIQWSVPVYLPTGWASYACFNPRRIAPHLDYMSVHFYPMLLNPKEGIDPELALQRAYLEIVARGAYVPGKPLVIEEFGWKGGKVVPKEQRAWPQEHQSVWGDVLMDVTSRVASGWLNWGYADAADPHADISAASGLWTENEELKHWGRRFGEYAAKFKAAPPAFQPPAKRWEVDRLDFLYSTGGHPTMQALADRLAADPAESVEMVFRD